MRAQRLTERLRRRSSGFTLTEVLIASGLCAVLMGAVMSTFLTVGRGGMNLANYAAMDGEARLGLDVFGRDIRQAEDITWISPTSFTVQVRGAAITYALQYDSVRREWQLLRGDRPVIKGVDKDTFKLTAYTVTFAAPIEGDDAETGAELRPVEVSLDDLLRASRETKQLQLEFKTVRPSPTLAATSNSVVSARFILRNKRVTS
jgi:type II secretory pathway pseudopilin PulG